MWAAQTAQSFIQDPNLGTAMALMNMVGIDNPLPINPYAVQSLVSGYGGMNSLSGLTGKLSSLNGLVTGSYSADSVYTCTDGSYACARQQQVASSNAGIKGLTSQIYQQLTEHIPVLQSLRTELDTASDPAQREHIMAQLAIENTWTANAQGQLQTVMALASTAMRNTSAILDMARNCCRARPTPSATTTMIREPIYARASKAARAFSGCVATSPDTGSARPAG